MITINCDQGDIIWFKSRAGVITASMFSECMKVVDGLDARQQKYVDLIVSGEDSRAAAAKAGYKNVPTSTKLDRAIEGEKIGHYSDKAKQYAFKLAIERLSGELLEDDTFETWQLRRGRELEPSARLAHEEAKGILVERTGLVLTDDKKFGASVDGLIGDDDLSEYKCFIAPSSLMPILLEGNIDHCKDQLQGGLWITGRKKAHFVLYCPALECVGKALTIFEVKRDDNYIEELQTGLLAFDKLVTTYEYNLRGKIF